VQAFWPAQAAGSPEGLRYVNAGSPEGLRYVNAGNPEGLRYVNAGNPEGLRYVNAGRTEGLRYRKAPDFLRALSRRLTSGPMLARPQRTSPPQMRVSLSG
jgi:hypothetical protein